MRRAVLALAATLALATSARAQAPVPVLSLQVVPVYSTPAVIKLSWIEPNAVSYNVYRTADGGTEEFLQNIPGTGLGGKIATTDGPVVATRLYTYRVEACNAFGCTSTSFTTSPRVVWPISGGHEVLHGFNEPIGWDGIDSDPPAGGCPKRCDGKSTGMVCTTNADCAGGAPCLIAGCLGPRTGYHDGLDLNKTTPAGQPADVVFAARGGVISRLDVGGDVDNGNIEVLVDMGGGIFERESFNHIATTAGNTPADLGVAMGTAVAPGQPIARIGTQHFSLNSVHHVHHLLTRTGVTHRNARNNLDMFTDPMDRDPMNLPPSLFDENGDGKVVLYRSNATRAAIPYDPVNLPLSGDIDIEPEVTDEQGTNPRQAPLTVGYWIEGPLPASEQLDDVKSFDHPYKLYDFSTVYYGLSTGPPVPCALVSETADFANAGCKGQGAAGCPNQPTPFPPCNSDIKDGGAPWPYPVLHHFIVTHASGEIADLGSIKVDQYWRTNAKDDAQPAEGAHANYANQPTTTKATEARFPDGDYQVHVIASDFNHPKVDLKLPDLTRIENFAPFIVEMQVAADTDGNPATTLPGLPGCELALYTYKHKHGDPYPEPTKLALAQAVSTATFIRANSSLCVRLRFSEPMSSVAVALVTKRGLGAPVASFAGAFSKTFQTNDTWAGKVTLAPDQSGNSDSSPGTDDDDVAVQVKAFDRPGPAGTTRGLDANGDGMPDPNGDNNALVKLDLSLPVKSLDVMK